MRIERRVGVLEDDLDVAPSGLQLSRVEVEQRLALERHPARRRGQEPQDDLAEGRLPAARLAHQAERLALVDREAHAVDGANGPQLADAEEAAADVEVLDEIVDLQQRSAAGRGARSGDVGEWRADGRLLDRIDRGLRRRHWTISGASACVVNVSSTGSVVS
jgi:hypothetical protein